MIIDVLLLTLDYVPRVVFLVVVIRRGDGFKCRRFGKKPFRFVDVTSTAAVMLLSYDI